MIRMRNLAMIALLLGFFLVACAGAPAETAVLEAPVVDPSTLDLELDVQTVARVKDQEGVVLLDVREQWEYDEGHIPGVKLLPMTEVVDRLDEIPTDKEVIITCRSGNRSGQVAKYLRQQGFDNVHNMLGGIVAWEAAGLPVEQ